MTLVSHWFVQRRRRIGRALLLGLALAWSTLVATPCMAALSTCPSGPAAMVRCAHATADASAQMPDCTPLMQLDCQTAPNPILATSAISVDHLSSLPMVLLNTLPITTAKADVDTGSALRHDASAAAVSRPPLNLLHARLLI